MIQLTKTSKYEYKVEINIHHWLLRIHKLLLPSS